MTKLHFNQTVSNTAQRTVTINIDFNDWVFWYDTSMTSFITLRRNGHE